MDPFKIICIGGGSIKGLYELGALHYLHSKNFFSYEDIHTFVGTSIGSIMALLMCAGYTPMDLLTKAIKIDTWMDFEITDFLNFKKDGGLLDIKNFTKHIEVMINQKLHFIPTLKQLYDLTHKKLIVTVTNVTKCKVEYLDYNNNPDLSCINAIQMSCSVPVIFKRFEYNDCYYVDGAVLDNFPIKNINNGQEKILGICVEGSHNSDNFLNYLHTVFSLPGIKIQKMQLVDLTSNCYVISLYANDSSSINFDLSKDKKMAMFCEGFESAKTAILEKSSEEWGWE